jgi:hypothetical protein
MRPSPFLSQDKSTYGISKFTFHTKKNGIVIPIPVLGAKCEIRVWGTVVVGAGTIVVADCEIPGSE